MSKAKFDAVKELIVEKKYDEARRILATIDHPTAREWEKKLEVKVIAEKPAKKSMTPSRMIMTVLVLILLIGVIIIGIQQFQQFTSTVSGAQQFAAEEIRPLLTATEKIQLTPTIDFDSLEATSEAISAPIRRQLETLEGLQSIRLVSALRLTDGASINVEADVVSANDNEGTMNRVLALIQAVIQPVAQLRVNTYLDNTLQRLWLWENGSWTFSQIEK